MLDRRGENGKNITLKRRNYLNLKKTSFIPFLILFVLSSWFNAQAEDQAYLWGRVIDADQEPIPGVRIRVESKAAHFKTATTSDADGLFQIWGLPFGIYTLVFEGGDANIHVVREFVCEPSQTYYIEVLLIPGKVETSPSPVQVDYTSCLHQTLIGQKQIREYPSGHSVWSLVENQDLSATTNRIDVGGLWSSEPSLFSARGGCSWTQSLYRLNGLDVTDPYWTGMPLMYPDFFSLEFTRLTNGGFFPAGISPGGTLNLSTRQETAELHGAASVFFISKKFSSTNITLELEAEGMTGSHSFNHLIEGSVVLSGPLASDKLLFSAAVSSFRLSRDLADYDQQDKASLLSGFFSLKRVFSDGNLRFLWSGQVLDRPSHGAGRDIPFSSTLDRQDVYNILQLLWNMRLRDNHVLNLGLGFNRGTINADFQEGLFRRHGIEIFENIPSGVAPAAHQDIRSSLHFFIRGDSWITSLGRAKHRFQYGSEFRYVSSSSSKSILDDLHLRFFDGVPLEIVRFNSPAEHRERAFHLDVYAQDAVSFPSFLTLIFGLHLVSSQGWVPDRPSSSGPGANSIRWLNISPRFGLVLPLSKSKATALKISLARFYYSLPLNYLTYGNPNALGGRVYSWEDKNKDRDFQEEEAGRLLRREGAFFSEIDEGIKRPRVDELSVSFHHVFGRNWHLTVAGFLREHRSLVESLNTGVPFSSYEAVQIFDIGDDRIPQNHDDLSFTVYNQAPETLGQDYFLLTNPDRKTNYYGLDLTLVKRYGERFTFFLTLTATEAPGTTSPGNTEWENDDGVVGSLFDSPNAQINARGRVRFDRAYTGRIGFNYLAPFGLRFSGILKYYDGQPFTRKIIVRDFNQGPFFIQAFSRGVARYEYNLTFDLRVEKSFVFEKTRLRFILDGFNIFNSGLATEENEWTGPEFPLRWATEIQSPRVIRLGLSYEF